MASSTNPHITDELLSAYIDNAVTEDERQQVEAAVAADPGVAWRLQSLRHTVHLLNQLPELAAPRSFALTVEAVSAQPGQRSVTPSALPRRRPQPVIEPSRAGFGGFWQTLFQGGNLFLRNAAAGAALVFLMLIGANFVLPNLRYIALPRVADTTTTAYPAIASTQPLATLTQIVNVASTTAIAEATPQSIAGQSTNAQAAVAVAQSAAEPTPVDAEQAEDAGDVALQSVVVSPANVDDVNADDANANDANTNDADLANNESDLAQNAPLAAAKQPPLNPEADQASAAEPAAQPRMAAQPATTPFPSPEADTPTDSGAASTEMVTASSVLSAQEAPSVAISLAEPESAPDLVPEQPATITLAPTMPVAIDGSAANEDAAAEITADVSIAEDTAPAAETHNDADSAVITAAGIMTAEVTAAEVTTADADVVEDSEAYSVAVSPATSADQQNGASQVAQVPAPAPVEQPAAAASVPESELETAPNNAANAPLDAPVTTQEQLKTATPRTITMGNLLWYAQIIAALCTLGFTLLWWRTRP
ncbi:MAG: hypothetical protein H6641_24550 [Caldilineaceae bacterium]|nr:hypothetical protein [Caldilineaceae bacterium]